MTAKTARQRRLAALSKTGARDLTDEMWVAVVSLERFTAIDVGLVVSKKVAINTGTVRSYLLRLNKGGYIRLDGMKAHGERIYILYCENVGNTPRLNVDGSQVRERKTQRVWRAIKILRRFGVKEVMITGSMPGDPISESSVRSYLGWLVNAGYVVSPRQPRNIGMRYYRIVPSKCAGPRAPIVRRRVELFDPNLDEVVYTKEAAQ